MAKKETTYRVKMIDGEPILIDKGVEEVIITPHQAKETAATARHLIRVTRKVEPLVAEIEIIKDKLRSFADKWEGFRGILWPASDKKVLLTIKTKKDWLRDRLKTWLGELYSTHVSEEQTIHVTIVTGKITDEEVESTIKKLLLEKGLTEEEINLVVEAKTDVRPVNENKLKQLAAKDGKNFEDFYESQKTVEVAVKDI